MSQLISLVFLLLLVAVCLPLRRLIFSWSCIGVFTLSNFFLVALGVLLFPWIKTEIQDWFPVYDLSVITSSEVSLAIILSCGGILMVLTFYQLSHAFFHAGAFRLVGSNHLEASDQVDLGFHLLRLRILGVAAVAVIILFFVQEWPAIREGVLYGFLEGRADLIVLSRRRVTDNYGFVLFLYNVLPFLGAAMWLVYRVKRQTPWLLAAVGFNLAVVVTLVMVFQKRPLVVLILALTLVQVWASDWRLRQQGKVTPSRRSHWRKMWLLKFGAVGGVIFVVLMLLYYFHTRIGRSGEELVAALGALTLVIVSRIVWRLAIPAVMYTHYFPKVETFYGFDNIDKLTALMNRGLFPDTVQVYEYFVGGHGSVASCTLIDFYGGFGLLGWFLGCCLLGLLLERLDKGLECLETTGVNALLSIFILVFVLYLSQASLPRSLLGYGGVIFVSLWAFLRTYSSPKSLSR